MSEAASDPEIRPATEAEQIASEEQILSQSSVKPQENPMRTSAQQFRSTGGFAMSKNSMHSQSQKHMQHFIPVGAAYHRKPWNDRFQVSSLSNMVGAHHYFRVSQATQL